MKKILRDGKFESTRFWFGVVACTWSSILLIVLPSVFLAFGKISGTDWVGMAKVFGAVTGTIVGVYMISKTVGKKYED